MQERGEGMTYDKEKANKLFDELKQIKEDLTEEDKKEMTASIIEIFRNHNLTYSQAYYILECTRETLGVMTMKVSI